MTGTPPRRPWGKPTRTAGARWALVAGAGLLLAACGPGPLATSGGPTTSGAPATTTPGVTLSTES